MSKRLENVGAEKWMFEEARVLDKGYVKLVSYDGTDKTIVQAARVSYAKQDIVKTEEEDNRLVTYLMKNQHWSPFEQCSLTFEIKAPIFVLRQLDRYRAAHQNQMSFRYVQAPEEFYEPSTDRICAQSNNNKQASGAPIDKLKAAEVSSNLIVSAENSFDMYQRHVEEFKVAREIARIGLPMSTYSVIRWQVDLRNLFNLLEQRLDLHAQWEIREYAQALSVVVKEAYPVAWAAWYEYVYGAAKLSRTESKLILEALEQAHSIYPQSKEVFTIMMKIRTKIEAIK